MKSALTLVLVVCLAGSLVPVTALEQSEGPSSLDSRGPVPGTGPLSRAAIREALRLAAEDLGSSAVDPGGGNSGQSDWSRVRGLDPKEIILTVYGSPPGKRHVVRGTLDEFGLTVLNLTDPTIPAAVTDVLAHTAWRHPDYFDKVQRGVTFELNRHTRLAPDGVFLDNRRVGELSKLVERVARSSVAEISLMHRATSRGFGWGALIGLGIGLAITFSACGTNWSQENSSCGNLTPVWVLIGPLYGTLIGGAVGATSKISTVVYRAP